MADRRPPEDGDRCASARRSIELLALDVLGPEERDELLAHVATCSGCETALARAGDDLGPLLLAGPELQVPAGFTARVLAATAGADGSATTGTAMPADGSPGRSPSGARWLALAVACVVVAVVLVAVGALVGRGGSGDRADGPSASEPVVRSAPLVTSTGAEVGTVTVDDGDPATLVMAVDLVLPGVAYDCVVRTEGGDLVTVGSWTARSADAARWSVALEPELGPVDEVQLVVPGPVTVATARLA